MSTIDRTRPPAAARVRPFAVPTAVRTRLDNGLTVIAVRHGNLPVVTVELLVDAGAAAEPPGREGIARLTVNGLETGTERRTLDELAWALESLGVELDVESGWDAAALRITAARHRVEEASALLAEIVREPAFPDDQVARLRDQQHATILQRAKDPRALASDLAGRFLFASKARWARPLLGEAESVAELDRDAVREFYGARYLPGTAALVVVGDIDPDAATELAQRHFGGWAPGAAPRPRFPVAAAVDEARIFVIDRPGAVQSELRIGHIGIARSDRDYIPLLVMNAILGGAFTSRLNMNLRERHGFTYGASSRFDARRLPGPFLVQVAVANDVTARAVEEILREIEQLREDGPRDEEVAAMRDYLIGILPLKVQTTDQLAARLGDLFLYDLPDDYFLRYPGLIAAVTSEDVQQVAQDHLHPDRFAHVIVGDAQTVAPLLRELGAAPVEVRPAT